MAVICYGIVQIRKCFEEIDRWLSVNGALINKRKCGIMPFVGKNTGNYIKSVVDVRVIRTYKYLGVPLDPALTLKNVVPLLEKRLITFKRHIGALGSNIVSTTLQVEP